MQFDGASQDEGTQCGVDIHLDVDCYINICLNCGPRSNTRGELLGLWLALFFTKTRGYVLQHIVGDSSVIISWDNDRDDIKSLHLCS